MKFFRSLRSLLQGPQGVPVPAACQQSSRRGLVTNVLTTLVAGGACVAGTALGALIMNQRRLIWIGQRANMPEIANPFSSIDHAELVRLSENHVGCFFSAKSRGKFEAEPDISRKVGRRRTVVYLHGNGDQIGWGGNFLADAFLKQGLNFFAIEYPGYGLAGGTPGEAEVMAAAEALLVELESRHHVPREDMLLLGQSIGCAPALSLIRKGFGSRLVLLSPFTSLRDAAAAAFPLLGPLLRAFPCLVLDRLDNAEAAPGVDIPTLLVHGTADQIVPFSQGQKLAGRFRQGVCRMRVVEGAGHNDLWDRCRLVEEITQFALS